MSLRESGGPTPEEMGISTETDRPTEARESSAQLLSRCLSEIAQYGKKVEAHPDGDAPDGDLFELPNGKVVCVTDNSPMIKFPGQIAVQLYNSHSQRSRDTIIVSSLKEFLEDVKQQGEKK